MGAAEISIKNFFISQLLEMRGYELSKGIRTDFTVCSQLLAYFVGNLVSICERQARNTERSGEDASQKRDAAVLDGIYYEDTHNLTRGVRNLDISTMLRPILFTSGPDGGSGYVNKLLPVFEPAPNKRLFGRFEPMCSTCLEFSNNLLTPISGT